jgi:acetone monooxygenase
VDLAGKRVGVVGVGATGMQVIQTIAPQVGHLTVFVLNPNFSIPIRNPKYTEEERKAFVERFEELKGRVPNTFAGFDYDFTNGSWHDATPEQRRALYERLWADGSLAMWVGSYPEVFFDRAANDDITAFALEKMRARLQNRADLCETLIPTDCGFGMRRVPLENGYLETFLRPNVTAVNCHKTGITEIVPEGVKTSDGKVHELDILILATGFDAGTGALTRIDVRGRGGRSLKDDWGKEIRTTMGLQVHGYPNLFTTGAPLAPAAALCNMTTCLQQQANWIADTIGYMRDHNVKVMEPTAEKEDAWVKHHDEIANATLLTKVNSWYMGSNVPGKPRRLLSYAGGVGVYKQACDEVKASGYQGFALS